MSVNSIQVVTFSSAQTLYGVMSSQVAGLYRASDEPSADGIVDLIQFLEGAADTGRRAGAAAEGGQGGAAAGAHPEEAFAAVHRNGKELVIRSHTGKRYLVPGPVELTELSLDVFQLLPSLISKRSENRAVRAAFAHGDLIGLLVDLDRVTVLS